MADIVYACDCSECKTPIFMPRALKDSALCSPDIWFCCPYGHRQHYVKTPAEREADKAKREADTFRRERDRLQQQNAMLEDAVAEEKRRASSFKGQVTRMKNRAAAGVCPCCNRSFQNLRRHMESQHPDFSHDIPEAAE